MSYICILGRQPALGLAELESIFGSQSIRVVQNDIVLLETDKKITFDHLGGVLKAAQLLSTSELTDWSKLSRFIAKSLPEYLRDFPEAKITLGLSAHGLKTNPNQINATGLSLKKIIKASGRSARIVPNKEDTLNTAQVTHNKLTGLNGIELVLAKYGKQTLIAQTVWVQDIEAYRKRDQERPMRDSRVGMLPPKLAQIIINLAASYANPPGEFGGGIVLDPFCGTGVLLQEAALIGYYPYGSDLEERMVDYSDKNLQWLAKRWNLSRLFSEELGRIYRLEQADATRHHWDGKTIIASETYLGRPLSSPPSPEVLNKIVQDCNTIHKKFLRNVAQQTSSDFRMCIAVPAWHTKSGFKHLPVLDHLEELGYNRVSFVHVRTSDLIYHREGQIVGRELVVLTRR